jgi:argininosuccinate lyase
MDLIETIFNLETDVTKEEGIKMADALKEIIDSFETLVQGYDFNKHKMSNEAITNVKDMAFFMKT